MGQILSKFDKVALGCSAVLIGTGIVKFFTWENLTPWNATRYLAIMIMSGVCFYSVFVISPRLRVLISKRQSENKTDEESSESEIPRTEFSKLHLTSVRLMMVNLVCGTLALLMA